VLDKAFGAPRTTKDGVSVAKESTFLNSITGRLTNEISSFA